MKAVVYNGPRDVAGSFIVSHRLDLAGAVDAYRHFDTRDDGWTKVILKPGQSNGNGAHASPGS